MKKIVIVLLVVFAFSWISVVSAGTWQVKESPESIVTCLAGDGTHLVLSRPVLGTINVEQCKPWPAEPIDSCAPCITSLEAQGCKVIDVVMTHTTAGVDNTIMAPVTYLLSCDGR